MKNPDREERHREAITTANKQTILANTAHSYHHHLP